MADVATRRNHAATYAEYETTDHVTGWLGFGGFMMIVLGMLHVINGVVGLSRSSFYLINNSSNQLLVFQNVRTWAWINLIAGAIVALAGVSLFSGATWARAVAVIFAIAAIAVNLLSIPLYPIWSVIAIFFAIMVMYAVIVHGGELRHEE
jgi:hypothetical protein